ncbi:MAG TPA: tripartite tricarboxylate transporter TctB family protein [Burkholderiales bacterium]|nr:tripartite tricarboxylate transporter TctB family protein [Burkholderiales bacterium]
MMNNLRNNKDFFSGLMFIFIGAGAVFIARDYPIGSATRMGPGYFPVALGGLLFLFGVYIMVQGLIKKEKMQGAWSLKAWIILPIATIIFGYLMDHAGFVPALLALIFISAAAGNEFKFREVLYMAVLLTVTSVGLFIYALDMPYPLFPWSR